MQVLSTYNVNVEVLIKKATLIELPYRHRHMSDFSDQSSVTLT